MKTRSVIRPAIIGECGRVRCEADDHEKSGMRVRMAGREGVGRRARVNDRRDRRAGGTRRRGTRTRGWEERGGDGGSGGGVRGGRGVRASTSREGGAARLRSWGEGRRSNTLCRTDT